MDNTYCSPNAKNKSLKNSCLNDKIINDVVNIYNKTNKKKINGGNNEHKIEILKKEYGDEKTWDSNNKLVSLHNDISKRFLPKKPESWSKDPWLSTIDIIDSLKQYDYAHTEFKFIGPSPIDFDHRFSSNQCVENDLCNLNLQRYFKDDVTKIGIIFNLDKHDQGGSHWVSMFINIRDGGIYYFDSVGTKPPKEIEILSTRLSEQGNSLIFDKGLKISNKHNIITTFTISNDNFFVLEKKKEDFFYKGAIVYFVPKNRNLNDTDKAYVISEKKNNKILLVDHNKKFPIFDGKKYNIVKHCFTPLFNSIEHQKENNECGIYSIHFIISMLKGNNWDDYIKQIKKDKYMEKHRDIFFRPKY